MKLALGLASVALLAATPIADATVTARQTRLPTLPRTGRPLSGEITRSGVYVWAQVGPVRPATYRVWRLDDGRWIVHRRAASVAPGKRRDPGPVTVDGVVYDARADLNRVLLRPVGRSGWDVTAAAFAWDPLETEAVVGLVALGDPLRLVLFRSRERTRGTEVTPFRSVDGGQTWSEGAPIGSSEQTGDGFGGGRLYAIERDFSGSTEGDPVGIAWSDDLGATWHRRGLDDDGAQRASLAIGRTPGRVAVVARRIWASDDGAASFASVATVRRGERVFATPGHFGDWLLIAGRAIRRVTLTR